MNERDTFLPVLPLFDDEAWMCRLAYCLLSTAEALSSIPNISLWKARERMPFPMS